LWSIRIQRRRRQHASLLTKHAHHTPTGAHGCHIHTRTCSPGSSSLRAFASCELVTPAPAVSLLLAAGASPPLLGAAGAEAAAGSVFKEPAMTAPAAASSAKVFTSATRTVSSIGGAVKVLSALQAVLEVGTGRGLALLLSRPRWSVRFVTNYHRTSSKRFQGATQGPSSV